jgi:hypothetical protein
MAFPSSEIKPIQVSNIKHEVRLCRRPGEDLRWEHKTFQGVQVSLILLVGKHTESAVFLWINLIYHVANFLAYSYPSWGWGIRPYPAKSNPLRGIEERSQDLQVHVSFMDSWIRGGCYRVYLSGGLDLGPSALLRSSVNAVAQRRRRL